MKTAFIFLISFLIIEANTAMAQQTSVDHKRFSKADSAAIDALVLYPDTIRNDIFEVCKYPEGIVRIANEQKNTSSDFDTLMGAYPKNVQQDLWNLSRYPGLVSQLAQGGQKSSGQVNDIASGYPSEIRETAVKYGRDNYNALKQMDDLQTGANTSFDQIIADYSPATQQAFRDLLQFPEVLSILNEHLDIAVLAGDSYRRDPEAVKRNADSLNIALTRQRAEEQQAWQDSIQQNPDAANDLKNAAADYATEEGYSQQETNQPVSDDVVNNYVSYPYPYWLGYPSWYPYSYWYPYPYWFDCGFYYNAAGSIVFIGVPSYNFTNWYFHYPEHWNRYPHLGNVYISHYYGPHRVLNNNSVIVRSWVHNNRSNLPQDFLTNKTSRVEAIREVGQLHTDVQKQRGASATAAERTQYLQSNQGKYPRLNASPQPALKEPARQQMNLPASIPPPVRQEATPLPKQEQPQRTATQPSQARPTYNYNRINNAQQYHRSTWEQAPSSRAPQSAPPARQQVAPMRQSSAPARQSAPSDGGRRR